MASNQLFVGFAMVAIILPTVAMATDFVVGDDQGWKLGVNYTEWANGKVFHVGDTLVFKYESPHNVYKVDGTAFKACNASGILLNSGNDIVPLSLPGKKWYICGFADHCGRGQKLVINVLDGPAPAPAPDSNDSYRFLSSLYQIFVAAAVVVAVIAI
ncbi:Mavicyanin, putative [Ricinus communis]|uniref:Mavicyanin, putative n=1 Tax=Ricinus communis TaxID=3988 RepID=B9SI96_RICCO|nr:Mavicyanin, putative [Ricinus communis]